MKLVPVAVEDSAVLDENEMLDDYQHALDIPPLPASISKGGLSPAFGVRSRRRAQLVARLKQRRRYDKPVRGGTGKQARTRRRTF